MQILIVSQYFHPESFRINDIARSLVEHGHTVDVLTGKPNYPGGAIYPGYRAWGCKVEEYGGAKVFRLPLFPRGRKNAIRLALNYLSFVVAGVCLGPLVLRKRKYDVIFVYGVSPIFQAIPASFIGWMKNCPTALWVQDLWPQSAAATGYVSNRYLMRLLESGVRFVYRHTDLLLVQSEAFRPPVGKLAPGKSIVYYPNSVETVFETPADMVLPEIVGLDACFSVMFAGNIGAAQAVEVMIDAAELLKGYPDIRLVILGNGSRWDWMAEQVQSRKLENITLAGQHPIETMPGLMRKASALLVTLSDQVIFRQTIPSKIQAYMTVGKPILACLNGEGARLVTEADAGLAIPAENAPALAAAILELYRMPVAAREAMGQNGIKFYKQHFDQKRLVTQLIDHLHTLAISFRKER